MQSASDLARLCGLFFEHGYHVSSLAITRSAAGRWDMRIIFADFLAFGTPGAELPIIPEFGEDSVPGGYSPGGVPAGGPCEGFACTLSGWQRAADYCLALDWPTGGLEQAEALMADFFALSGAIDWSRGDREDGVIYLLIKPGKWLVGLPAAMHADAVRRSAEWRETAGISQAGRRLHCFSVARPCGCTTFHRRTNRAAPSNRRFEAWLRETPCLRCADKKT